MKSLTFVKRIWQIARTVRRLGLDESLLPHLKVRATKPLFRILLGSASYDETVTYPVRLRQGLEELGPIFVKFGQIMSTRPDIFPDDVIYELSKLQDQVPPFDGIEAQNIIESELGSPIDQIFSRFDQIAIASASVAQVHHAELLNGDEVIVKVLRPGVEELIERDINVLKLLAKLYAILFSRSGNFRPNQAVQAYGNTIRSSLDLLIEASSANRFRASFKDDELLYIPRVYFNYTSSKVMIMERVGGIPIREVEQMKEMGIDLNELATNMIRTFFRQAFFNGFFHGDVHPGNLFVTQNGRVNLVDYGIMGTLTDVDKNFLAETSLAILRRDYRAVVDVYIRSGWAPPDIPKGEFETSVQTICEPFLDKPISEVSFSLLLGRMLRMTREFGIRVQPQLLLFQKTYLNLEGLTRMLAPEIDMSETIRPILKNWMRERYGVRKLRERIKEESVEWATVLPELPRLAHSVLTNLQESQQENKSFNNNGNHWGIAQLYRGIFFTILGGTTLIGAILNSSMRGEELISVVLVLSTIVCWILAWPKRSSQ